MVVCGKAEFDPYFETEPYILVEVLSPSSLSPSSKDIDLREKMLGYKSLPSLQSYLVVDADLLMVRRFWREEDGRWQQQDLTGDGDLPLPPLDGMLSLPRIYRNIF